MPLKESTELPAINTSYSYNIKEIQYCQQYFLSQYCWQYRKNTDFLLKKKINNKGT